MPYKLYAPGKRGPCWYARGTDSTGPFEVSTGKDTERAAARWIEEVFLPDRVRRRTPGQGEAVGFRTAAQAYKAANPHLSRADRAQVDDVANEIGDVDCRLVGHARLVSAAEILKPGRSDATKNRKVIVPGAAVLHYAATQDWCPHRRIEKFHEPRKSPREPATDATLARLMAHIEEPPRKHPNGRKGDPNLPYKRLLLAMLYELGLRITDNLRIDWPRIDLQGARISARIGKTDDYVSLEISREIVAMLANLPREKKGRLFPWSTRRGVYAWLNRARERAGVHYTPHLSRHALATAAGLQRIPDGEAAKLGAWSDPRSLHRYQHVQPEPIPGRSAGKLMVRLR